MADDVKVPAQLVDELAALLVFIQQDNPTQLVFKLDALKRKAKELQEELRQVRGPSAVCHFCKPPVKLLIEEIEKHDRETHGVRRTPCKALGPNGLTCGQPKGHIGNHSHGYNYWSQA